VSAQAAHRVALVTGAAQGIGRVIAQHLAELGFWVAVADVEERVADVARALTDSGYRAAHVCFDVGDPAAVRHGIGTASGSLGEVDVLVNNAGIVNNIAPVAEMAFAAWQRELGTNLTGAFNCIQAVLPGMVGRRFGRIVNVSSIAAWGGLARQAGYAATKAGLIGLTKTVALEHARDGITCNAVLPGLTATERVAVMPEGIRDQALQQIPARRLGQMSEIAAVVGFLATDAAAYVNGAEIPIDGGMHLSATVLGGRREAGGGVKS
jgi:NAD(P)-dependent dehydrogenase (short-subunit alcohol dehydrogenase family)